MARLFTCFTLLSLLTVSQQAAFRQMKLFNWGYKDLPRSPIPSDNDDGSANDPHKSYTNYPDTTCPDGWIRFHESCYWVEEEKFTFAKAEQRCHEKNATLLVLNSQDEWEAIHEHTPKSFFTWIGLYRPLSEEHKNAAPQWQTEGAMSPSKINWLVRPYAPTPNGWSSISNCVAHFNPGHEAQKSAYSFFYPCHYKYHSVCERNSTIIDFLNRNFDFRD